MTRFLASVTGAEEAAIALAGGADIIDLKNPLVGALGALPLPTIAAAVKTVRNMALTSATIGDLTADSDEIPGAVRSLQTVGVDFIKIGLFPYGGSVSTLIDALADEADCCQLAAVLFADRQPDLTLLPPARRNRVSWCYARYRNKKRRWIARQPLSQRTCRFCTKRKATWTRLRACRSVILC